VLSVVSSEASAALDWHKMRACAFSLGNFMGIWYSTLMVRFSGIEKSEEK
jgi:hypothetical protein